MREFDQETIQIIAEFERLTGSEVRDCIKNGALYFLVNSGKAARAIGRGGQNVQAAERALKKQIKVYEWHEDPMEFIKNLIPQAAKIEIKQDRVLVSINSKKRGSVIGTGGFHIKILREFVERNSSLKGIKII